MTGYELQDDVTGQAVMAVGRIPFEGNITPMQWFRHLCYQDGKNKGRPNPIAILLLSDIVYWYRPLEVRDEYTGQVIGYRKKFKGKKLQRAQKAFANQFGFSYDQVRNALDFLEDAGVIKKEIVARLNLPNGNSIANVLYIELIPKRLREITVGVWSGDQTVCAPDQTYTESTVLDNPIRVSNSTYNSNSTTIKQAGYQRDIMCQDSDEEFQRFLEHNS